DRMDRVQKMMMREISVILQNDINDPRVRDVTITRVEVTRDLREAKAFYVLPEEESNKEEVATGLRHSASFVRKELAERITLKYIPRISFREDKKKEREESVDRLFTKIEEELGIETDQAEGMDNE
ncbi:30S ribosome-binding factor RbfA, partial [Candidatus Omnitrophota bacterium]